MAKGSTYPSEKSTFQDQETGVTVHRLTNHLCHSSHGYFTHRQYYAGGQRMLFYSDRDNAQNLFGLDLDSGEIRQITGFGAGEEGAKPFSACVNPVRDEAYFLKDRELYALDLSDLSERLMWERPEGVICGPPNCSADGRFLYFSLGRDMSKELPFDVLRGYVGFREYWEARPHCRVVRIPTQGGDAQVLWEEDYWIGHVNASPTIPNILTFCHEGPWTKVDQRIWGLDADTHSVWPIRPQHDRAIIGHEYWFADGSRVGYHGRTSSADDAERFWGYADYCTGSFEEYEIPQRSTHFHSLDANLVVSDGCTEDPYLMVWRWNGEGYDGALLCKHRCSMHIQRLHVHPMMTPDGKGVVFTSDLHGYGNIYYTQL